MQVEVDVKCMETKFGECGFSGFGDFAPLAKIPFHLNIPLHIIYEPMQTI